MVKNLTLILIVNSQFLYKAIHVYTY